MKSFSQLLLKVVAYVAFLAVVGYFSAAPSYSLLDPEQSLLRISFSHAGERAEPCRKFSPEEIAKMAPNMRRALDCSRERVSLQLQVELDGNLLVDKALPPAGLSNDGASSVYLRIPVTPGQHVIVARLRDSVRQQGFDYESQFELSFTAKSSHVLSFDPEQKRFRFL